LILKSERDILGKSPVNLRYRPASQMQRVKAVIGAFAGRPEMAVLMVMCLLNAGACNFSPAAVPSRTADQSRDRMLPVALTDQHGETVLLSSLKGKFALVDFIYTSCPGTCLLTTARMAGVARSLGTLVGRQVILVSVTVDPERDGVSQLLEYAKNQGVDRPGWLFLTGAPGKIDEVLRAFNLPRQKEPDGQIDHITYCFLVGPDGREQAMYDPLRASAGAISIAIKAAMARGSDRRRGAEEVAIRARE
jgi:protein SCO1/2